MSFQFAPAAPAKPRRISLTLPEDLAVWAETQAGTSGTLEAVLVQAIEFSRASQSKRRVRNRSAQVPQGA